MRIAVAEDHDVFRHGIVRALGAAGATVVAEAASGSELLAFLRRGELPDAVVMDIRMNGNAEDGLTTATTIIEQWPQMGILLLSDYVEAAYAQRLFATGSASRGYMHKSTSGDIHEIRDALTRIIRGGTYTDPLVLDSIAGGTPERRNAGRRLTEREVAVLDLLAAGLGNGAIAAQLHFSRSTVEAIVSTLYTRMEIPDDDVYNRRVLLAVRWITRS